MTLSTNTLCGMLCGAALTLSLASCSDTWSVSGNIAGTDDTTIYLESQNNYGRWTPVDSAKVSGDFSFSRPAAAVPDIYRLRFDDHCIYFPVEGDDRISVTAEAASADTQCRLAGSPQADLMDRANTYIYGILSAGDTATADSLKRELYTECLAGDTLGLVSYYTVTKRVGGRPVYDPAVKRELGIIGAVANSYATRRPDDPRTKLLNDYFLSHKPKGTATVRATAIDIPEITLTDENGRQCSLTDVTADNKAVILNFTVYAAEQSGALNLELRKIHDELAGRGLAIYQVDVMSDRSLWRHTAVNLPWTTVYVEDNRQGVEALQAYQVTGDKLPLTYLITDGGIKRIDDIKRLQSLAKAAL